jgi:AcrR family transcriptional regulator
MTKRAEARRRPGRPRSEEADAAILTAALELLLERGASQASIEQVAQRAGVTRATVYRRFPDKTALLVQAIESMHGDEPSSLEWRDIEHMIRDWAGYLSHPRGRKMLRRLNGAADDYPELLQTYVDVHGRRRTVAVIATLSRARDLGLLPAHVDVTIVHQLLNGAALHHLSAYPDTTSAAELEAYFGSVLAQVGYRSAPEARLTS